MTKISDLKKRWMADPKFRKEYEKADAEFEIVEKLIRARTGAGLSQLQIAKRLKTTQSAVARLESGSISPSLLTLRRYAKATGNRLQVELRPE